MIDIHCLFLMTAINAILFSLLPRNICNCSGMPDSTQCSKHSAYFLPSLSFSVAHAMLTLTVWLLDCLVSQKLSQVSLFGKKKSSKAVSHKDQEMSLPACPKSQNILAGLLTSTFLSLAITAIYVSLPLCGQDQWRSAVLTLPRAKWRAQHKKTNLHPLSDTGSVTQKSQWDSHM